MRDLWEALKALFWLLVICATVGALVLMWIGQQLAH